MSKTLASARMPSLKDLIREEEAARVAALEAEKVAEELEKVEEKEIKKRKDYKNKK